jgi:predicted aspartyl protease
MIKGTVDYALEPVVTIGIEDNQSRLQSREVVIDTGFSGE